MSARVLVATDLSDASDEAVRQSHVFAGQHGTLTAVYVVPRLATTGLDPLFPAGALQATLAVPDLESRAMVAVQARVRSLTGREDVAVLARVGVPEQEIIAAAASAEGIAPFDAIVVGSHGRTGLARMLLGSVAEKVARSAPCHVLVARHLPPDAQAVVVIATDLTEASDVAFDIAIREATQRSARLFAVHAIEDPHVAAYSELAAAFGATALGPPPEFEREVNGALASMLARKLAGSSVIGEAVVVNGNAATALVRLSEQVGASLLVVGTGKKSTLERLAIGSVAEKIVRHTHCSVLVARHA